MKRSILIKHNDESPDIELEIGKAVSVALNSDSEFIYIEKMKDGKWRLTASKKTVEDFSKIDCLKIHRED